jgi:hypothetical protein
MRPHKNQGSNMIWQDAQALINEIHRNKCSKAKVFLDRLETTRPATLSSVDSKYLQELYRHAAGGGCHIHKYFQPKGI